MPNKKQCMESFKLFGVQIDVNGDNGIRKSKSLDNLHSFNPAENVDVSGYLSDELIHQSSKERKKGKPWSEDEHRSFLLGLEKLGKGNWKGIATNFVPSRDSSQVASHAQKYFNRMSATEKKRRRPSVFDIPLNEKNQPFEGVGGSSSSSHEPAESSEKNGRLKEASNLAHVMASERPPLSPMKNSGIPYFYNMPYMPRVSGTRQAIMPTITWVPFANYSSPESGFLPSVHGDFTASGPQPSTVTLRQGSSQPTKNDELNLNIRKLTL